jgi:fructose-6-phosphate aldolase
MEFMIDTANLEEIENYNNLIPLSGVTSNPTIVKKEGKIDFYQHMRQIRKIIGDQISLHIQVVATDYEGIIKDAKAIIENIDKEVYIKIPVNEAGIQAIKTLKNEGYHVTATAVYTKFQAYLAIAAKADYIAPYYNRMENLNIDPNDLVKEVSKEIARTNSNSKILGASFKNVNQVNSALENGAHAATMSVDIIKTALTMPSIQKAVNDFNKDWESIYGNGLVIADL